MSRLQDYLDDALKECTLAKNNDEDIYKILGSEITNLRTQKGMTQNEFVRLCDIQQSNISRLENGTYNPSLKLLEKIAKATDRELKIEFVEK